MQPPPLESPLMANRRSAPEPIPPCYAIVHAGLEPIAEEEITNDLSGEVKRTARGLVVFRAPRIDKSLLELRTIEDVFLYAWGTDQLTYRAADLDKIRKWTAREANWQRLFQLHHSLRPKPKGKTRYRLVTQMTGEHGYRRIDARKALIDGLAGKIPPTWRHVEEGAMVEIWLTIHGATAICGVRLSDRTMRHRAYKREHRPASLRPTVAAAMVRLANIEPRQVIVDPMCGVGTILAETFEWARAHGVKPLTVWAGDLDLDALRAAGPNLRNLGHTHLARWDGTKLPFRDRSIDRILCNPPFGKQLATPEEIGPLYQGLMRECRRVLKPRGQAVLLVSDPHALRDAAQEAGLQRQEQYRIRLLGQVSYVSVWKQGFA